MKINKIFIISCTTFLFSTTIVLTSCSKKDLDDYVGSWDGKNWRGYQSGSLVVNELSKGNVSIVEAHSYVANDLIIPRRVKLSNNQIEYLTQINDNIFSNVYWTSNLTGYLILPRELKIIGTSAFEDCNKLTGSLTIPSEVTTIGRWAFQGCTELNESLTFHNKITHMEGYTFANCSGFKELIFDGFDTEEQLWNNDTWGSDLPFYGWANSGVVKVINGNLNQSQALSFAKYNGLPNEWI
jgi:hypothetical protein